jgi:hypothetical protein
MKLVFTILLLVTFAVAAQAQSQTITAVAPQAKVYTELMTSTEKIVKEAPFSAEAISESVQTLADGNRIVRSSSTKLYRDSEGRFRRENTTNAGGSLGFYYAGSSVTIIDPVSGFRYMVNDKDKTAHRAAFNPKSNEFKLFGAFQSALTLNQKLDTEQAAALAGAGKQTTIVQGQLAATPEAKAELERALTAGKAALVTGATTGAGAGQVTVIKASELAMEKNNNSKTEALGKQMFDGVEADGTRTVTTIPAGEIGNERPIEIVYERWYSSELQMIVYSKHSDPRYGDQTYRLANFTRSEPDPSVFAVPADYKILAEPTPPAAPMMHKILTTTMPSPPAVTPVPAKAPVAPKKDQ